MTGTFEDFTGDDDLEGFDAVIGEILIKNELGGVSNGYELKHAPGTHSGFSFGGNQMDLSKSAQAKEVLQDILINARDGSNNLIFSDGAQFYSDHLAAIISTGNSSALDTVDTVTSLTYKQEINAALASEYGIAAINDAFPDAVTSAKSHVDSIINALADGNIKTTLQSSQELQAYLIDHYNQFGIRTDGNLVHYLQGMSVTPYSGPSIKLDGMITLDNLKNYLDHTKYATGSNTHDNYESRQQTIADSLDEHGIGKFLSGNASANNFTGSDHHDVIDGKGGIDTVNAGDGDDLVIYRAADNSPLYVGNEILSGGDGDDTLKLEFRSSELTYALREELLNVYNLMVVNPSGTYSHTFTNLNLEITDFEHMEVWVDGHQVSLDPLATNSYFISGYNPTTGDTEASGYLFSGDNINHYAIYQDYRYEQTSSYSFGEFQTTPGTYATVQGGSITIDDAGHFNYSLASNLTGQDSYDFILTDSGGHSSNATVYFSNQELVYDSSTTYTATTGVEYHSAYIQNTDYTLNFDEDLHQYLLTGLDLSNTITGSAYADIITSAGGNDIIHGGDGNDVISGGGDYSDIFDLPVYDPLPYSGHFFQATSEIYGDAGNDTIFLDYGPGNFANTLYGAGIVFASGGDGDDVIWGTIGSYNHTIGWSKSEITIEGNNGNDTIFSGDEGQDTVDAGSGNDSVTHFICLDSYIVNEADTLDGGSGNDSITFVLSNSINTEGLNIDLSINQFTYDSGNVVNTIENFENVKGTEYDDIIHGSSANNIIDGGEGNNELYGYTGDDILIGGSGNDTFLVNLSEGVDTVRDSGGADKILFGTGILAEDLSYSRDGDDLLIKDNGTSLVRLGDHFISLDNVETLQFSDNSTLLLKDITETHLDGSSDSDILIGDSGNIVTIIDGKEGDDHLYGGGGLTTLHGGDGDDVLVAGSGDTYFDGGSGYNTITGGTGNINDLSYSNIENLDHIGISVTVGATNSTADHDGGQDTFSGINSIQGTQYDDTYVINSTISSIHGLSGNDTYYVGDFSYNFGHTTIYSGDDDNSFYVVNGQADIFAGQGNNSFMLFTAYGAIESGNGNNYIELPNTGSVIIHSGSGDDTYVSNSITPTNMYSLDTEIHAGDGTNNIIAYYGNNVQIETGIGNDTIDGSGIYTTIHAGLGDDLIYAHGEHNYVYGEGGNDNINFYAGDGTIETGNGNDVINISTDHGVSVTDAGGDNVVSITTSIDTTISIDDGNNQIMANSGNDTISVNGTGENFIYSGLGNDVIHLDGGTYNHVYGEGGADHIYNGSGQDSIIFDTSAFNDITTIDNFDTDGGDALNISSMLTGYTDGISDINDFVSVNDNGTDTSLYIDRDGAGSSYSSTQIATLTNLTGQVVDDLYSNHNLIAA